MIYEPVGLTQSSTFNLKRWTDFKNESIIGAARVVAHENYMTHRCVIISCNIVNIINTSSLNILEINDLTWHQSQYLQAATTNKQRFKFSNR